MQESHSSSFLRPQTQYHLPPSLIVYMQIFHVHVPNDCSATWHLTFLVWGGVRGTTDELVYGHDELVYDHVRCYNYSVL